LKNDLLLHPQGNYREYVGEKLIILTIFKVRKGFLAILKVYWFMIYADLFRTFCCQVTKNELIFLNNY